MLICFIPKLNVFIYVFLFRRPFGHNQVSIFIDGVQNISAPAKFTPLIDVIYIAIQYNFI